MAWTMLSSLTLQMPRNVAISATVTATRAPRREACSPDDESSDASVADSIGSISMSVSMQSSKRTSGKEKSRSRRGPRKTAALPVLDSCHRKEARMSRRTLIARLPALLAATIACMTSASAQSGAKNGEWRTWGGDLAMTRYAPLDQINADNFGKLEVAWTFKTERLGKNPDYNLQATPLMINGVLYFTAGAHRDAVAVDG